MVEGVSLLGLCMAASGLDSLVSIDDVTHDGCSGMNSEVYRNVRSVYFQGNASKPIGRNFGQQDNDPKHNGNASKNFIRGMSGRFQTGQINHLLKRKLKEETP